MQGLGGLADSIMQGVARAGPSSFQKNIMETQQQQKQNLINALRDKYETGFRGKQLSSEEQRSAITLASEEKRASQAQGGENARHASELAMRKQEAAAGRQQSGIEKAAMLPATGIMHPSTWGKGDEIEAVRSQLLNQGQSAPSLPVIKTHAQYLALPAGTKYQDSTGKAGVKR